MNIEARPSLANVYLVVAIGSFFGAAYAFLGEPAPPVVGLFAAYGSIFAVAIWFRRYLAWCRQGVPFDYGYFLLLGWWLLIPIEQVRMHGRRGWRLVGLLYALALAPLLIAALIEGMRL